MKNPHLVVVRDGMRTPAAKACVDIADSIFAQSDPEACTAARGWITTGAALDKASQDGDVAAALEKARKKGATASKLDEARRIASSNVLPIRGGS